MLTMLPGVLQNVDMVPLMLLAVAPMSGVEETVHFCEFLTTPSDTWMPAALNSIPLSPFRMAFQLHEWLHFGREMPDWFEMKGGRAYERL